ncbi:MAG TPA: PilN domain-containing protein [Permianibacter sp.]|nr:PilN domain-containing protein [Permianibacter sp.]
MQQINLFLPEFAPTPQRFGLRVLLRSLLGVLLLLLLIGVFLVQQLAQERERTQAARQALDAVITTIGETRGNEQARQNVAAQLEQLRAQLAQRQALLQDLQQREAKQTSGFASLLQTLAETHDQRLWLTTFSVKGDHLQLSGETLNAAAVPAWLSRLQAKPPVQGLRFAGLQMQRVDAKPGVLAFSLTPELPETGDAEDAVLQR